jgi:hypothetical protein
MDVSLEPALRPVASAGPAHAAEEFGLQQALMDLHARHVGNRAGAPADYIPELTKGDPDRFGLAIATTRGDLYTAGDAAAEFTIQSVSKAFAFCVALELLGRRTVLEHVGVEPSGAAFNAIVFDPRTNRPFSPMVNAGAITIASLLYQSVGDDASRSCSTACRWRPAGRWPSAGGLSLGAETGHRNRAIGHLLRGAVRSGAVDPVSHLFPAMLDPGQRRRRRAWDRRWRISANPVTGRQVFERTPCATRWRSCSPAACTTIPAAGPSTSASRPKRRRRRRGRRRQSPARHRHLFAASTPGQLDAASRVQDRRRTSGLHAFGASAKSLFINSLLR